MSSALPQPPVPPRPLRKRRGNICGHRWHRIDQWPERHGFLAVLYSRLILNRSPGVRV
jgi:hypothetical protein